MKTHWYYCTEKFFDIAMNESILTFWQGEFDGVNIGDAVRFIDSKDQNRMFEKEVKEIINFSGVTQITFK